MTPLVTPSPYLTPKAGDILRVDFGSGIDATVASLHYVAVTTAGIDRQWEGLDSNSDVHIENAAKFSCYERQNGGPGQGQFAGDDELQQLHNGGSVQLRE